MQHLRPGHVLLLLQGAKAYFEALTAGIDASRSEVWLESYIYHRDAMGQAVTDALVRAAERGVRVCLTVDGVEETLAQMSGRMALGSAPESLDMILATDRAARDAAPSRARTNTRHRR